MSIATEREYGTRRRARPAALLFGLCAAASAVLASGVAAQEAPPILIERGDVLSVSVLEEPSLDREAKVDVMGRLMLPHVGSIGVAGQSLDEIRQTIEQALSRQEIIREPTVIVDVASYRPFFIGGAVEQQGAVAYEPGLTVRHALLLAGGLKQDDADGLTLTDLNEMTAEVRATTFALFEVNSRIARLEAELELRSEIEAVGGDTLDRKEAQAVSSLDSQLLSYLLESKSADRQHLKDLMGLIDYELDVLRQQSASQDEERELQRRDVENARELLKKGLTSEPRVRELEREHLALERTRLDVQAYTARARQNKETIGYQLENADLKWRTETLAALRAAVLERTRLEAEADLLAANFLATGLRLNEEEDLLQLEPEIIIYRIDEGREHSLKATMTTAILPGDVLDVTLATPQG
ncbi:polysaccharide biosynthesis/export family protein [Tranquillimonas alkanivorans]|nr:polysaccharide biosynthesis/export family protein [Tranquillimonas alkanivorans]